MKVVFIGNSCEHVVRPLCDYLYEKYGDQFLFIETEGLNASRTGIGSQAKRPYIFSAMQSPKEAKEFCANAEAVIFGAAPLEHIEQRIKENKLTLYYSERLFKKNILRYCNPITYSHVKKRFINPSKNSNFHLLCASSFAALDFYRVKAFRNRMYKWGYQVEIFEKDIDSLMRCKPQDGLSFIWVGRLIKLKHCDHAIKVVSKLIKDGYPVRLTIIGSGPEEKKLKRLVIKLGLQENVIFKGVCPIEETRAEMDKSNVFLFTSDFKEGWGATLNECMNSGCACVASHVAGSTYFLAKDGVDSLIYPSGSIKDLYEKTLTLIQNKQLREQLGRKAYEKMYTLWNPKFSGERMVVLIETLLKQKDCYMYNEGPCSKAEIIKHRWYK